MEGCQTLINVIWGFFVIVTEQATHSITKSEGKHWLNWVLTHIHVPIITE